MTHAEITSTALVTTLFIASIAIRPAYAVPPDLTVTGTCPGNMSIVVDNATPSGTIAIIGASGAGGASMLTGPCTGGTTGLDIDMQLAVATGTDGTGSVSFNPNIQEALCGTHIQVLDVSSCSLSPVEAVGCPGGCPPGCTYGAFGGSEYLFCDGNLSWQGARDACAAEAMGLAEVQTVAEHDYLLAQSRLLSWIGFTDAGDEGVFESVSRTPHFDGWSPGEPSNDAGFEDCAQMWFGGWNDSNCDNVNPYVCETCTPGVEVCDGQDNDCDGQVDEDAVCAPSCTGVSDFGSQHALCTDALTYDGAAAECASMGMHLVTIDDARENGIVEGGLGNVWIGFTDRLTEGVFEWDGGPSLTGYTNFAPTEPNNQGGNEDCVSIYAGFQEWNDQQCTGSQSFACEP